MLVDLLAKPKIFTQFLLFNILPTREYEFIALIKFYLAHEETDVNEVSE